MKTILFLVVLVFVTSCGRENGGNCGSADALKNFKTARACEYK